MKTMVELISWFQMEHPDLVESMRQSSHHLTKFDVDGITPDVLTWNYPVNLNPYHLEGDVFTHTMMVCKQAEDAPYLVRIAALLHDIGKPSTRKVNPKNGRVSFYNHDAVSAFMSLKLTKELGLSEKERAQVFNLIALHTQIFKQTPEQLGKLFTNEGWLGNRFTDLGRADSAGRFYEVESETNTDYFTVAIKPEKFSNKEVHILCGLPASGKSTWVDKQGGGSDRYLISRDNLIKCKYPKLSYGEAFKTCNQKQIDKELRAEFDLVKRSGTSTVFVDMTHMSKKSRRRSLSHFGPEYKHICHVFLTDLETIYLRNSERHGKVIGQSVFDKMIRAFYTPTLEEFDEIVYHF